MEKKPEQTHPDGWLRDQPIITNDERFKPEEMTHCPKCGRVSPPTRAKCFYCGAELPLDESAAHKLNFRRLENWEKGFNLVVKPPAAELSLDEIAEIARLLKVEADDAAKILTSGKTLPLARVETVSEAEVIAKNLAKFQIDSVIVSDEDLRLEIVSRRLRGIEFSDDRLIFVLFNNDEIVEIKPENLKLIVAGSVFERRIASTEKYERKKENKILETSETSRDEIFADVYAGDDLIGYRVEAAGFDFSCLDADKKLLAGQNIKILIEKLRAATAAEFDDDYQNVRHALGAVWAVGQKRDALGLRKKGMGRLNLESVTIVGNEEQFTKYSRLRRKLL